MTHWVIMVSKISLYLVKLRMLLASLNQCKVVLITVKDDARNIGKHDVRHLTTSSFTVQSSHLCV